MTAGWLIPLTFIAAAWPWGEAAPPIPLDEPAEFTKLLRSAGPAPTEEKLVPPSSASLAWMTESNIFAPAAEPWQFSADEVTGGTGGVNLYGGGGRKGLYQDPDLWRFRGDLSENIYRRTLKVEVPNPDAMSTASGGRLWKTDDRFQIPIPVALPVAERLFVYGQVGGKGDTLDNRTTTLTGKTGVGMKWTPVGKTELQFRYGTWLNYADVYGATRFQERAQPAFEVLATLPLISTWSLEYTGSALPAVQTAAPGQIKQELRLAIPLGGDNNEFEFGARYRWDMLAGPAATAATPWLDRAQLFMGLKFRR